MLPSYHDQVGHHTAGSSFWLPNVSIVLIAGLVSTIECRWGSNPIVVHLSFLASGITGPAHSLANCISQTTIGRPIPMYNKRKQQTTAHDNDLLITSYETLAPRETFSYFHQQNF